MNDHIEKMKSILAGEQFLDKEKEFRKIAEIASKQAKVKELELINADEESSDEIQSHDAEIDETQTSISELNELITQFNEKLKSEKLKLREAAENLITQKNDVVQALKDLVDKGDYQNSREPFKKINDDWKALTHDQSKKSKSLEYTFNQLLEEYYYNLKIHTALKNHDHKRNKQLKEELIEKLEKLVESDSRLGATFKQLQIEWRAIGPVRWEDKEDIWARYKEACRKIIELLQSENSKRKEEESKSVERKQEIINEMRELNSSISEHQSDLRKTSDLVKAKQAEWKNLAFTPKPLGDELWKEFRSECDSFFVQKNKFFDKIKEQQKDNKTKKLNFIERAEKIANGDLANDEKANGLIRLQKDWKSIGRVHPRDEQKLWTKFRAVCNAFFEQKKTEQEKANKEFEASLSERKTLLEEIEKLNETEDFEKALSSWYLMDTDTKQVPKSMSRNLDEILEEKIGSDFKKLKLDQRLRAYSELKNADLISITIKDLKEEINHHNSEKLKLENNLGFFSKGSESSPIVQDLIKKVDAIEATINDLKERIIEFKKIKVD